MGPEWRGLGRRRIVEIGRGAVPPILAALAPVLILLIVAHHLPGNHSIDATQGAFTRGRLSAYGLFLTAASPFLSYRTGIDLLFFAPVFALYAYALVAGKARTDAGMLTVGLVVFAVSLVMPLRIGDGSMLDRRLPLMAAYLLFAGALPDLFETRSRARAAVAGMLGLTLARTLWIGSIWLTLEANVRAVKIALSSVPAGAAVLTVLSMPDDVATAPVGRYMAAQPFYRAETTLMHVPAMAVPWRKAFVPTIFTVPGQHPLRTLPPWTAANNTGAPEVPDIHALDAPPGSADQNFRFLADWRDRYQYVLAMGMDCPDYRGPFTPPRELKLVSDEGYARLYRVER
jgi:hypothetical protein